MLRVRLKNLSPANHVACFLNSFMEQAVIDMFKSLVGSFEKIFMGTCRNRTFVSYNLFNCQKIALRDLPVSIIKRLFTVIRLYQPTG